MKLLLRTLSHLPVCVSVMMFEERTRILEIASRPLEPTVPCWRFAILEFLLTSHNSQHPLDLPTRRIGLEKATAVMVTVFRFPRSLNQSEDIWVQSSFSSTSLLKPQTCTMPPDLLTPATYSWSKSASRKNFLGGRSRTNFLQWTRNGPGSFQEKKWKESRGSFTILSSPKKLCKIMRFMKNDSYIVFLDALASLEPTQVGRSVGRSVGHSFKLWAIGALSALHILHNFAHFALFCKFCTILHILHNFTHFA